MIANVRIFLRETRKLKRKFPEKYKFRNVYPYFLKWLIYNSPNRSGIRDHFVWFNFPAEEYLRKILSPDQVLFEYGSGGSTLYFASQVNHVTAVEHHPQWYINVKEELDRAGAKNIDYFLEKASKPENADELRRYGNESQITNEYSGQSFKEYVTKINEFDDGHFDIIVIDGRARVACLKKSMSKIKIGGYIIVDNSEREFYFENVNLDNFSRKDFFGPGPYAKQFWQTTFFKRIK